MNNNKVKIIVYENSKAPWIITNKLEAEILAIKWYFGGTLEIIISNYSWR